MEITVGDRLRLEIEEIVSLKRKPIIEGWMTAQKGMVLADLVVKNRPQLCVESGTFGGRSAFAIALALRENASGLLYTIDPWSIEACTEGDIGEENKKWWTENVNLEDIYQGFVEAVLDLGLTKQCRWIRAKSETAAKMFMDGAIDLCHVDSNHSELVSCREVDTWARKIARKGFWVWDDSNWSTQEKALKSIPAKGFDQIADYKEFTVFQKR